jgi:hypothetical protein
MGKRAREDLIAGDTDQSLGVGGSGVSRGGGGKLLRIGGVLFLAGAVAGCGGRDVDVLPVSGVDLGLLGRDTGHPSVGAEPIRDGLPFFEEVARQPVVAESGLEESVNNGVDLAEMEEEVELDGQVVPEAVFGFYESYGGEGTFGSLLGSQTVYTVAGPVSFYFFDNFKVTVHPDGEVFTSSLGSEAAFKNGFVSEMKETESSCEFLSPGRLYFSATGITLSLNVSRFYTDHGGADVMGIPLTDWIEVGKDRFVQYFTNGAITNKEKSAACRFLPLGRQEAGNYGILDTENALDFGFSDQPVSLDLQEGWFFTKGQSVWVDSLGQWAKFEGFDSEGSALIRGDGDVLKVSFSDLKKSEEVGLERQGDKDLHDVGQIFAVPFWVNASAYSPYEMAVMERAFSEASAFLEPRFSANSLHVKDRGGVIIERPDPLGEKGHIAAGYDPAGVKGDAWGRVYIRGSEYYCLFGESVGFRKMVLHMIEEKCHSAGLGHGDELFEKIMAEAMAEFNF